MRVLIMCTPAASHLTPMVPLLWALRTAGHEVLVAGQPDITDAAVAAGLPAAAIGDRYDAAEVLRSGLAPGRRPNESGRAQVTELNPAVLIQPWLLHARYLTSDYLAFARQWRPDLVLSDPMELSAAAVAGILEVPLVHHRWDLDTGGDGVRKRAHASLGARFARLGLRGELPRPVLSVDPCPPSVQLPAAVESATPVRYVPFNGSGTVPQWCERPPLGRRVAVTFGAMTALLNGMPMIRHVVDALAGLPDTETLVTLPGPYAAQLAPSAPSVQVVEPLPLHLFLDSCALVVHHGGTGSTLTSCAFGLPQLVLPQLGNEPLWADRLAAAGAARAVTVPEQQNDPSLLRDAARALLEEPDHAEAARRIAAEMAALPTPADVVPLLEKAAAHPAHRPGRAVS
ncbi:nucleotide disphospho-sugar-binding domain-containing protein [Streptomyces sp. NPDC048417]|uniref:nucleotide disphospho-sugar-binding domain-containing protein n=1 Tax=Streptomyces sp. NPDC048417 TaxID=3155387 RepID=UPI0034249AD1